MTPLNRRDFIATSATAAALATAGAGTSRAAFAKNALPAGPQARVVLGKTGIETSLIGMGSGTVGGGQSSNQTKLGIKGLTKVVRH